MPVAASASSNVPPSAGPEGTSRRASKGLLAAALAGLSGISGSACKSDRDGTPAQGMITSSMVDETLTMQMFTEECEARHGDLEVHGHCGGMNSCKGLSYDTTTHVLTEHTCKAMNTCTGYSCVIPD